MVPTHRGHSNAWNRYIALQNDRHGVGPLSSYFKGEIVDGTQQDIFTRNMCMSATKFIQLQLISEFIH